MKKRRVLVFPCGSEVGLEVRKAVEGSKYFLLVGASSILDHGQYVYDEFVSGIPYIGEEGCIAYLSRIVKEHNIDAIYPTMDLVIFELKKHEQDLGCKVIASDLSIVSICVSKRNTYEKLAGIVPTPEIYCDPDVARFPAFLKPNVGYGGKNTRVIQNRNDIDEKTYTDNSYIVSEYLGGDEYTVDCFTNRQGKLMLSWARRRERIKSGISVSTKYEVCQNEFSELAIRINDALSFRGAWFFQVKRNNKGELKLLEIAARIAGSSGILRTYGINLPLLTLYDAFEEDLELCFNKFPVTMDRAFYDKFKIDIKFKYVYIDYDDCLVFSDGTVNYKLVAFIYRCINEKKKIVLLSRHRGDILSELKEKRLNELFDDVIQIANDEKKSDYIKHTDSIFIDDSYRELSDVSKNKEIPIFPLDMTYCLNDVIFDN